MKKYLILFMLSVIQLGFSQSQEWITSMDISKRLAMVQNKMIFAVWEDATLDGYNVLIDDENGNKLIVDMMDNEKLYDIICEYFVPVIISESSYPELFAEIDGKRKPSYIDKFNDDSIKIMDVNGNIINIYSFRGNQFIDNISRIIARYGIDTSFLKQDLISYSTNKNFTTSFFLASKYVDFVTFANKSITQDLVDLSNIYLNEALDLLSSDNTKNKLAQKQAVELLKIKQQLVLNKPKKAVRQLKRIKKSEIQEVNRAKYNILNYTAFRLLKDEKNAEIWKTKVSLVDLNKANLIIKHLNVSRWRKF